MFGRMSKKNIGYNTAKLRNTGKGLRNSKSGLALPEGESEGRMGPKQNWLESDFDSKGKSKGGQR